MDNKTEKEFPVLIFIGAIFTFLGALWIAIALGCLSAWGPADEGIRGFFATGFGIGSFFFILGMIFLVYELRKRLSVNSLVKAGNYVYATITEIGRNENVIINGENPYVVVAEYEDPATGEKHVFRSRDMKNHPRETVGNCVKVYLKPGKYQKYFMETDKGNG